MTPLCAIYCVLALSGQAPPVSIASLYPATTTTRTGMPGDPVNLILVGTRAELCAAFQSAGWSVADPITARSAMRIGVSVALKRPYPAAPVSDLYLFGRTQDLAFELSVGPSARTRHHVRFWQAGIAPDERTVWVGSGTFDLRVGRSPATGRLTHRISPDVDAEREIIISTLEQAGGLTATDRWPGRGPSSGRNGEGDCYYTDGMVTVGVLAAIPTALDESATCRWSRRVRQ